MKLDFIHSDDRGKTFSLTGQLLKNPEITIFYTKEGMARGGCIHNINDEYLCVIEGKVLYVIGDSETTLTPGISKLIPKNTPHYFVSLTDSIVIEWGATLEEKKNKHSEFRKIVDKINEKN